MMPPVWSHPQSAGMTGVTPLSGGNLPDPHERGFRIWQGWLLTLGVVGVLIGILMIVAVYTPVFAGYNRSAAKAFFATEEIPVSALQLYWWLMATMRAGVIGWSLTLVYIVAVPFGRRERWAYNCLVLSLAIWVVLDVAIAIRFGVTGELVYISIVAVGLAIPLGLSRRYFHRAAN